MKKPRKHNLGLIELITYYGYTDGSGEYYIVVDSDKCDGCGECTKACPQNVLQLESVFVDLDDKTLASVNEENHKKIKYTCAPCKPENGKTPCVLTCKKGAITTVWNPR
jgi:ferredoxin